MRHIDIIREAYDKCGITYVVRQNDGGWSYLFLCDQSKTYHYEHEDLNRLTATERFMEFAPDGEWASY